jgi:hypothetical protein
MNTYPTNLPADKADLLRRIHAEWTTLEETLRSLSEAQITAPGPEGWSPKDHLAHLAIWERVLLVVHLQGRAFAEAAGMDEATARATQHMTAEDGLNDYFYRRDRDLSLEQVMQVLHTTHRQLLEALEAVDFEELMKPRHPGDAHPHGLIDAVIWNTYEHYSEHRRYILGIVSGTDLGAHPGE